jgi:hypothetical protein
MAGNFGSQSHHGRAKSEPTFIQGAQSAGWPTLAVIYVVQCDDLVVIHEAIFEKAGFYQAGHV